jgi:hypothetical protein
MMDGGYPDGVHVLRVPGNSHADEAADLAWIINRPRIEMQARDELRSLCATPATQVRAGYLEYCAEHGITSIPDYVRMLERINARTWERTVRLILRDFTNDGDVA